MTDYFADLPTVRYAGPEATDDLMAHVETEALHDATG